MNTKNITCCFTGHRAIPSRYYAKTMRKLRKEIIRLIEQGVACFGAGGALGFDTMAAQTVLELKNKYPQIKLILVLPCKTQTCGWTETNKAIYESIKASCNKYVYTSEEYTRGCMHKRNRHLVDNSDYCICYLAESFGGTAYTVDYAKQMGLTIINLAKEKDW